MFRNFVRNFFLACSLFTVALVIGTIVFINQVWHFYGKHVDPTGHETDFIVNEGESFTSVADRLAQDKIVANAFWFRVYAKLSSLSGSLQSGAHTVVIGNNYADTLDRLTTPSLVNELQVTIPEGYTIKQMGELLTNKGLVTADAWTSATGV